jgi:hypothetical protein
MKPIPFILGMVVAAIIAIALMVTIGCTKPMKPIDPTIKRCAPWVCAGQEWPGDFTNCTCRED